VSVSGESCQYFVRSVDSEATYLTCDIAEPAKDKVDNAGTECEDEEHQGVEIAFFCEFGAGVIENVCKSCENDSLYRINSR